MQHQQHIQNTINSFCNYNELKISLTMTVTEKHCHLVRRQLTTPAAFILSSATRVLASVWNCSTKR